MKVVAIVAVAVAAFAGTAQAEEAPPLSGGRLAGEAAAGAAAGTLGLLAGVVIGDRFAECNNDCDLGPPLWGAAIGYTLAVPVGVWVVGSLGDERGSLAGATLGSVAGAGAGLLFAYTLDANGVESDALVVTAVFGTPIIGAMIGFNLTRGRDDEPAPSGALVTLDGGRPDLGVPLPTYTRTGDRFELRLALVGGTL